MHLIIANEQVGQAIWERMIHLAYYLQEEITLKYQLTLRDIQELTLLHLKGQVIRMTFIIFLLL